MTLQAEVCPCPPQISEGYLAAHALFQLAETWMRSQDTVSESPLLSSESLLGWLTACTPGLSVNNSSSLVFAIAAAFPCTGMNARPVVSCNNSDEISTVPVRVRSSVTPVLAKRRLRVLPSSVPSRLFLFLPALHKVSCVKRATSCHRGGQATWLTELLRTSLVHIRLEVGLGARLPRPVLV